MVLFLGVCRALKAMHQYRVKGAPGGVESQKKARRVREEAAHADEEAAEEADRAGKRPGRRRDQDDDEEQGLMDGEVTRSQEGVAPGQERSYSHRDIKPGESRTASVVRAERY